MQKKLKEFFTNDEVMLVNVILCGLFIVLAVIAAIMGGIINNIIYGIIDMTIMFALLVVTVVSYFKHDKNVMKCTIGAVLAMSISFWVSAISDRGIEVYTIMPLAFSLVILISHLLINRTHHSSPTMVLVNQIVSILFMIASIVLCVLLYLEESFDNGYSEILLAYVTSTNVVLVIESKLDNFRIKREENKDNE